GVTVCVGHVRRNQRSRCRNPSGHLRRTIGHVPGIAGHVGPEYSPIIFSVFMRAFCIEHRRSIVTLLISSLWIVLFTIWTELVTANPIDVPIDLGKVGEVNHSVSIFSQESYTVHLVIERGNKSVKELELLMGSMRATMVGELPPPSGILLPLQWSLSSATDGRQVASGSADTKESSGWSAAQVFRTVGYFSVPSGRYTFHVKTLSTIPEFSSIPAKIVAQTRGSTSSTSQMSFVWWGTIATYVVVWPMAALALLFLIYRGVIILEVRSLEGK
ncbi:MAG: hypothetical protein RIR45_1428, partial [Pseudomonadota bacterium]